MYFCFFFFFFFSSRRRHTRCETVTGVPTCALPICLDRLRRLGPRADGRTAAALADDEDFWRSEERRVGKECSLTCGSRWSADHYKNNCRENDGLPAAQRTLVDAVQRLAD